MDPRLPRLPRRRAAFTPSGFANRVPPRPVSSAWGGGGALEAQVRQLLTGASAAERYDLDVLRLGGIAPPTLPPLPRPGHTAARDGDLARQEARMRYSQLLLTRSQQAAALQQTQWADVVAGRIPPPEPTAYLSATPKDEYHTEHAARGRATAYQLQKNMDQMAQNQPEATTIGQGVGIGLALTSSAVVSEVAIVRLASGMRFVGATRAATVVGRLSFAEGELLGARAGWQGYQGAFAKDGLVGAFRLGLPRLGADFIAQGGANYIGSKKVGVDRFFDATGKINLIETGMATFGLQPAGVGVGSALFQYSLNEGFKSPLNGRVSWTAFGAQAVIGSVGGYTSKLTEQVLSPKLRARLAYRALMRGGPRLAYPAWLGAKRVFPLVPHAIGIDEEYLENMADEIWPASDAPADSSATGLGPANSRPTTSPNLPPPAGASGSYYFKLLPL